VLAKALILNVLDFAANREENLAAPVLAVLQVLAVGGEVRPRAALHLPNASGKRRPPIHHRVALLLIASHFLTRRRQIKWNKKRA
jgi:hypothetical protein